MYICEKCGEVFESLREERNSFSIDTGVGSIHCDERGCVDSLCPYCHGELVEAKECHNCDEYVAYYDYCDKCLKELTTIETLMDYDAEFVAEEIFGVHLDDNTETMIREIIKSNPDKLNYSKAIDKFLKECDRGYYEEWLDSRNANATYHDGDVLDSGCDVIAHQLNLQGVFGGGLAKQIAERYPDIGKATKKEMAKAKKNGKKLYYTLYPIQGGGLIANCFTQDENFDTQTQWLCRAFRGIAEEMKARGLKTIAVPYKYGCGIANGDWRHIEMILRSLFMDKSIELQIWKLKK